MSVARPTLARLEDAIACARDVSPCETCDGTGLDYTRGGPFECGACGATGYAARDGGPAREVWEALASRELIPVAWVDDRRRRFRVALRFDAARAAVADNSALVVSNTAAELLYPGHVDDCVAFAADVPGVLQAEAVARDVVRRDVVVWRVDADYHRSLTRRTGRESPGPDWWDALHAAGYAFGGSSDDTLTLVAAGMSRWP